MVLRQVVSVVEEVTTVQVTMAQTTIVKVTLEITMVNRRQEDLAVDYHQVVSLELRQVASAVEFRQEDLPLAVSHIRSSLNKSFCNKFIFAFFFFKYLAQQTLIQKHIYVHVPPPEPEVVRPQQQIQAGVAQKHYKIIFIKAPSPPTPSAAQIALAQQSQEKTIVYVLVKKPDEVGDIQIPTIAPTQPSKPEVYFIKYKTAHSGSNGGIGISASGTASAVGIGGGQISGSSATSSSSGKLKLFFD